MKARICRHSPLLDNRTVRWFLYGSPQYHFEPCENDLIHKGDGIYTLELTEQETYDCGSITIEGDNDVKGFLVGATVVVTSGLFTGITQVIEKDG